MALSPGSFDVAEVEFHVDKEALPVIITRRAMEIMPEAEIVEGVLEYLSDEYDPKILRPLAVDYTRKRIVARLAEQKTWPAVTDCDRLDAAFAQLEKARIVCRHDFTCCGTCGAAEIWDEIENTRKAGRNPRGYAFYHQQDTESAVEGHGLYFNYGATEKGREAALRIGNEIAKALRSQGLQVDWDGTLEKRIKVNLDWKRRRK